MNNREKKEVALVASGIILGAALAAPVAGAALTAQQSSQKIVVDGKPVQIEAYSIGGNNYCKLRDVGKAVGFYVSYDPLTNTVLFGSGDFSQIAPGEKSQFQPNENSQRLGMKLVFRSQAFPYSQERWYVPSEEQWSPAFCLGNSRPGC